MITYHKHGCPAMSVTASLAECTGDEAGCATGPGTELMSRPVSVLSDWQRLLDRVTIRLPFKAGIGEVNMSATSDDLTIALWFDALDSVTQKPNRFHSVRIIPMYLKNDRERLMWLRAQWREMLEHELDESLLVDGKQLRDPHIEVNSECPDHPGCRIAHVVHGPPTSYSCTADATKRPARRVWTDATPLHVQSND